MAVTNSESLKSNGTYLGRRIARADGVAKVTGRADYALEHDLAGIVHAVIVESTVPIRAHRKDRSCRGADDAGCVADLDPCRRPAAQELSHGSSR